MSVAERTTIDVIDKYTGEVAGTVPVATVEDVAKATEKAKRAFLTYSEYPAHKRAKILGKAAELLASRQEEIATIICREAGKAWKYSVSEVARSVETFTFAAEEA